MLTRKEFMVSIKFKQMIPAPDWFAVFVDYMEGGNPSDLTYVPLVCWAIVPDHDDKNGEDELIQPMIYHVEGGVEVADGQNLVGIVHASQRPDIENWIKRPSKK